jgi:hypothetical protein
MKPTYKKPSDLKYFPFVILGVLFISIVTVLLVGFLNPSYSFDTPEKTWDAYLKAINDNNIELYANIFYEKGSEPYNAILEDEEMFNEIKAMSRVVTLEFSYDTNFSVDWNVNRIANAKILFEVNGEAASRDISVIFRFIQGRWYIFIPE